jgi:hypothetical protein
MNNSTYDDLNEFGSAQQQPQLESVPIVDSPNFIHEHISDVVNGDLAAAKRNTQNGYAKKYGLKIALETRKNKNQLADLTKSNEKLNELNREKGLLIKSIIDMIIEMALIDDPADFCKAFKDRSLRFAYKYAKKNFLYKKLMDED